MSGKGTYLYVTALTKQFYAQRVMISTLPAKFLTVLTDKLKYVHIPFYIGLLLRYISQWSFKSYVTHLFPGITALDVAYMCSIDDRNICAENA